MVAAIVAAHVVAGWGLLQVHGVREAVAQAAPMFVSLIAPAPKPEVLLPPPPPPTPQPVQRRPSAAVIAAAPTPAPAPFTVVAALPAPPEPTPQPAAPEAVAAAPAPTPAPAPVLAAAPRIIPASAVQYLEPIVLEYPRQSKRMGETGHVLIRVFIDEAGAAQNVQVNRSSGHSRLDDAALAAIRHARFKPYTENGKAIAGWAFVPLDFQLEQ